jgi:predicted AlkP superfamily phosphohydrolase/phosphomutase
VNKVLLIGLDGGTLDLIEPWIIGGYLPVLKDLIDNGACGYLESVHPPVTPPAWVSMASGKNPGKHGVFDWINADGSLVSSRTVSGKRIWNILSDAGYSCCVMNVPVTYPPERINGCMVSCQLSPPGSDYAYPQSIMEILDRNGYKTYFEGYWDYFAGRMIPRLAQTFTEQANKKRLVLLREAYDILGSRCKSALELMQIRAWDFFFIVFPETDVLQHVMWDEKDTLLEFYVVLDRYLGQLVHTFKSSCCGKDDKALVLVASDHGFGNGASKLFNVEAWLAQQGELSAAKVKLNRLVRRVLRILVSGTGSGSKPHGILRLASRVYGRARLKPALVAGFYGIYIDRKRFRSEEAYETKRSRIVAKLKNVSEPEGRKVFVDVFKRESLYYGKNIDKLPDIIFTLDPEFVALGYSDPRVWLRNPFRLPGHHMAYPNGLMIVSGDSVRKRFRFGAARIYDVAPTILHILGQSIPNDMDGKVLKDLFEKGTELGARQVCVRETSPPESDAHGSGMLTTEEEEEIKRRLRALGYIA